MQQQEASDTQVVMLNIGSFSSSCGACGRSADPYELAHTTELGYGGPKPGCGATFTHVASSYIMPGIEQRIREMRPDLIYVGF